MAHWTHRLVNPIIRIRYDRPGTHNPPTANIGGNAAYYTTNYAGNLVCCLSAPNAYYEVQAAWTVPYVSPTSSKTTYSAIWPGIGAFSSNETLVQAGTEQDYIPGYGPSYYAWYEAYCNTDPHENMVQNFSVSPGDSMFFDVNLLAGGSDAAYSNEVSYTVEDVTTGEDLALGGILQPYQRQRC